MQQISDFCHRAFKPVQRPTPFYLHVLTAGLLFLSIWGWLRLQQSIYEQGWMDLIAVQVSPVYTAITGAVCGAAGLASAFGLWLRQRWAVTVTVITVSSFSLWYWLDRILLSKSPAPNTIFSVVTTLLCLIYTALALMELKRLEE
jgi:hypothetical protein